jgi:hypothetical protein
VFMRIIFIPLRRDNFFLAELMLLNGKEKRDRATTLQYDSPFVVC